MKTENKILRQLTICVAVLSMMLGTAHSQYDPMFTQYMWNEMYMNPAYAGAREALSTTALLRNQWVGIEGAPKTQTLTVHGPLYNQTVGLGFNLLHEQIGVLNRYYITGAFAYRIKFNKGKFSFGLSGGMMTAKENLLDIKSIDKGDKFFQSNSPNLKMPNTGFGMYYYTDRWYAGLSIPRLIENKVNEASGYEVKNSFNGRNMHYYITGGYVFGLYKGTKIKPTAMIKNVYGAPIEMDLSINAFLKDMVWVGAAWRTGDAISFLTTFQINPDLRVGYSYDFTTTALRKYNSGSHEISIGYDFKPTNKKIVSPRLF